MAQTASLPLEEIQVNSENQLCCTAKSHAAGRIIHDRENFETRLFNDNPRQNFCFRKCPV